MKYFASTLACFCSLLSVCQFTNGQDQHKPGSWNFTAGQSPVYQLETIRRQPNAMAVVTTSIDGTTACFSPEGKQIWTSSATEGFPFDLSADDIDGDGCDEVLVASGNGSLYAYDSDGRLLWVFKKQPPLYQVCVARDANGKCIIFTGGVEQVLYALSPEGTVINSMKTEHCIRHLRAGNVLGDGSDYLAMATASSGLTPVLKLFLLNPHDFTELWNRSDISVPGMNPGRRFFSMLLTDLDKDGKEEVVMGGGWRENGMIYAFNDKGETLFSKSDRKIPSIPYRMCFLSKINVPGDEFILGHFGNVLIIYEANGDLREVITGPYSFADSWFDEGMQTLFMGSEVSGGNEIYAYRLDQPGWKEAFINQKASGRLKEIENNLDNLNSQISEFKPPAYQPAPKKFLTVTRMEDNNKYKNVEFVRNISLSQKADNPDEVWCRERDNRMSYKNTADELVKIIEEKEANGENILVWSGHGNAVFFPLPTFERLIKAGPEHLKGFVFAEMEGIDEQTQEVVEKIIFPLAEMCREHGKIILFRNKNIFWNGTCYLPFWKKVLLNDKYKDVFVPGLEESNSRSQDLSLAGRAGLWQSNCFSRWACSTITDNANFDRMFEWGGQQLLTHHLRNLVSAASMGASIHFSEIVSNNYTGDLFKQFIPYYDMLEKGIIQIPEPENLLSCSDFALVMKSPPSSTYLKHGINGHRYSYPTTPEPVMVFNQLDAYWGGSILPDYDFSAYAMNVKHRTCNFLPELPYGLVPIIPEGAADNGRFSQTILTNGEVFYNKDGKEIPAPAYKEEVVKALNEAAAKLPLRVVGEAHWSAVKLDEKHIRLILIDPGYLDPSKRDVEIIFQHIKPRKCFDILSGETLKPGKKRLALTIPAGIFRIIDLEL